MRSIVFVLIACWALQGFAQQSIPLTDMSSWKGMNGGSPASNWKLAGAVSASLSEKNKLQLSPGTGVLVCDAPAGVQGEDILSTWSHGDIDIDVEFMMANGANSGIYLQGRYELQLLDSWGKLNPGYNDCGGIYERWDDAKPEGQKGYQGHAPRANASKAPGLWQKLHISFQAPRFDPTGNKVSDARILLVRLNDVVLHENVVLTGPTRGSMGQEVASGPLRIQGDHGSVAFRNLKIRNFNGKPVTSTGFDYAVIQGKYSNPDEFMKAKPIRTGKADQISWDAAALDNEFGLIYKGKINVADAGLYNIRFYHGGTGALMLDGKMIFDPMWRWTLDYRDLKQELTAGEHQLELFYYKGDGWLNPALGLEFSSDVLRAVPLQSANSLILPNPIDPILINTGYEPVVTRSFIDILTQDKKRVKRVVHAVSVGFPQSIHYSYDLDRGAVFQVWKGGYLDATPMWHDRGDGSSQARGAIVYVTDSLSIWKSTSTADAGWMQQFRPKGYSLDEAGIPTFHYLMGNSKVEDKSMPSADGKSLVRNIKMQNGSGHFHRAAEADQIVLTNGVYTIGQQEYYIKVLQGNARVESHNGKQVLWIPTDSEVKYEIIW